MKIVHISANYIDGWGYQENLLPFYQKQAGHEVVVITTNYQLFKRNVAPALREEILAKGSEYFYEGVKVYKIETLLNISSTSFICRGLHAILEKESPDMVFHHNVGMATLSVAARYKKNHPQIRLFVDNHADWINESKNKLWHLFYYDLIAPLQVNRVKRNVDLFIGVSPLRCEYLRKVYRAPEDKIRFLPIGCDTNKAEEIKESCNDIREKYSIPLEAFVIVNGGKIDRTKGALELISACKTLKGNGVNICLVLFGKIDEEVVSEASKIEWIKLLGWCDRYTTLSLLKMADVACWPWLHTTLIEDSVAVGTPLVVKMSDNVKHFAREKAGVFMEHGNKEEIESSILTIQSNVEQYRNNVLHARDIYSYSSLARRLEEGSFVSFK